MNMGKTDRIIRAIAGVIVLVVAFFALSSGAWQIVLWVVGAILLLTAAVGFCPAYSLFHFSTKRK
jgi:hypothetical protein